MMTLRLTLWLLLLLLLVLLLVASTKARPQDLGTGMALAVGQLQQLMDTGGGARQEQSIEILGQKLEGAMQLGIGQAMNLPVPG